MPVHGMLPEHGQASAIALPDQPEGCARVLEDVLRALWKRQHLPDKQPVTPGQQDQCDQDHGSKAGSSVGSSGPLTPWLSAPEEEVASPLQ